MDGYRYRVVIGGTCTPSTTSDTAILTVYQRPEVTAHPVAKTICEGDNTFFRVNPGVTTNPAYQWEVDQGSGFNPVVPGPEYSGINDDTLQIIGGTSAMNNWQYRAIISGTCAPDAASNPAVLTVRERPEIISQPTDSTICEGSSASFTVDAGVTTGASYQWQVDPNTGTFVNVAGAGYSGQTTSMLNIFNAPSTWNGYRYRVIISGSCSPAVTSDTVILTVLQRPEITAQPANAVVCEDGATLFTVNPGVTTNPTFMWLVDEGSGYDTITGGIYTGYNTATLNLTTTSSLMNGYLYKVIVGGTCTPEVTSSEVLLTIHEKPEVVMDPVDTTVCEGTGAAFFIDAGVTTNPQFKWQVNTGAAWADIAGAPYMGQSTSSLILTSTTSAMYGYRYRAVVSGICTPADTSGEATLYIYEKPEITVHPVDQTECEDGTVIYFVNPGVTTNPTFQWQVDKGSGYNDITDLNYSGINDDTLIVSSITSAMHGYRYRVIVSGTCAPADAISNPARLYINEKPEVSQHPANMTICENDNAYFRVNPGVTTNPTFAWEYSSDNGFTWNPVPAALPYSGTTNDTLFITGATSALHNYQYRAIVSGTCTPDATSNPGILTVHIRPVISLQPDSSVICENDNTTFTVDAGLTTSPTYQWQVDQGSGFNNVGGSVYSGANTATLTLTNVPSYMTGYRYQVIVGGACSPTVTSDIVSLTVYEKPEIMIQPAAVTVCEDDNTMFIVNPGVTTDPTYVWQVDQGGGYVGVPFAAPYSGADNDTLLITGVTSGMNNYRYRVIISGTCTPSVTSNGALLTVREKPEITVHPVDQTICEDGNTSFTVNAGVTTNPTYQWQMDPNTGTFINVSGGFYSGQNSPTLTITGALSALNGYRYHVIVGGYCSPAVTSNPAILNINEKPEIIRQPVNQTVCEDDETYFAIDAGVTTNPTYEWQVDDGGGFVPIGAGPYSGINTDSLIITAATSAMHTYMYRVVVSGTCTPQTISFPALLFVNEKPEVAVPPADTVVCENDNAAFFVDAGVTSLPTYRWQVNTGAGFNNISDGGKYIGSMTSKLSIFNATADMNGYTYRVVIGGSCAPQINSPEATLTVNTKPYITGHPDDVTICEGDNTSFSVNATGTFLTYEWQVDKNDGNGFGAVSDGGIYSGAATATLQLTGADRNYNNYNYRVIVNGTCAPPMTSNIARLMVNTPPEILTEPVNSTICEFNNTSFFVIAAGGNISYQWQEDDGISGWQNLSSTGNYIGATSPSLNIFNIARDMNGYRYRVLISGICTPDATSAEVLLTVNTKPEILAQPSDTTVCETLPVHFSISAQGTNLLYQWQEDGGGGFTDIINGGKYSGANTAALTISDPTPLMTGYRYRVMINGACAPPALSNFAILTVNTFPSIITQPADKEICENGVTAFISNASGTGISYHWQEDSGTGFTDITDGGVYNGANTTTLTISNAPVSLNGYRYRLQVIGACAPINSNEVNLIVNANPTAGIDGDGMYPMVCGGIDLNLDGSPAGGSGTYTTHSWSGDVFPLTVINTQTTVFNTVAPGSYNLTYTVTDSEGCKGSDVTVITNERPQVQFVSDAKPSCGLLTVNFTNQSTGAVSYEWDFDDPSAPGIVTEENPTHDFTNFTSQIYYYNVSLVGLSPNGCGDTMRQVVTIYPSIDASFTIDPVDGCNPVTANLDALPGGSTYFWDFDDGNAEYDDASATHPFINTTGDAVVYTVELTTTSFYGCSDTKTADITVYPLPVVNFSADPALQQYPASTVIFTNLTPAGSWTYLWQFGDGTTSTAVSPVYTYAGPGDYNVILTAQTAECIDSIVHKITIIPAAPVADFSPPATGCAPLEITFDNQSEFATSFIWDFGNGSQSTKENPTFTYYESGIYAVKLIVYGPGGTDNITRLVEVKQTPVAYSNIAPTYVFVNDVPVKCFNLSTDTVRPVYLWDFGDNYTSNEFEPVHIYTDPGRYDVTLTVTNENECSDEYVFSYIEVEPAGQMIFPNVFKPNPDGPSGGAYRPGEDNNEVFFPGVYEQVAEYELVIYNRWGELIFISNDVNIGWDGYFKGKLAEQGVYIWKVKVKYANGKVENLAGDITLLR
jgi:gliding motility-associated-like protein